MKKFYLSIILMSAGASLTCLGQQLLDAGQQPKFTNILPLLPRIDATTTGMTLDVAMQEFIADLGLTDVSGQPLQTTIWGYNFGSGPTYPGKTIVAKRDVALNVFWRNELDNGFLVPVDTTILWPFMDMPGIWNAATQTPVPAVTHLHGGHTESVSDGLSEAWYTPGYIYRGSDFLKTDDGTNTGNPIPFYYDNDQRAATLWYHDHALGVNRLSIYSGLAGTYLLRDAEEDALISNNSIPSGNYETELIIQDKMFSEDGSLYYPSEPEEAGQPAVSILPEFFGDFILVNGKAWPKMEVEPRPYRFRIVNASDSRFYKLYTHGNHTFWQIGTDGGLLDRPVSKTEILLGPAERADLVIDFSNDAGKTIVIRNSARAPFPSGEVVDQQTTGLVMAFAVNQPLNTSVPVPMLPTTFSALPSIPSTSATRRLLLFEAEDEYGRLKPSLGTVTAGVMGMMAPATETPALNATEMWEIFNATEDAHPIHLHLVQFRAVNSQRFDADVDEITGALSNIKLKGQIKLPSASDKGWKDTYPMYPGEVTRIVATFDRAGKYAWHCHILSHADHEMMRPFEVGESNRIAQGMPENTSLMLAQNFPNPFSALSEITFNLPADGIINLSVFDIYGKKITELINELVPSGSHTVYVDSEGLANGIYYYVLKTPDNKMTKRMEVIR